MSGITSEDCKNFLVKHFEKLNITTKEKDWKRNRKYKDEKGQWCRDFVHHQIGLQVVVEDSSGQLTVNEAITKKINERKINEYQLKVFSNKDKKGSEKILKAALNGEEAEDIQEGKLWENYAKALPCHFKFNFQKDTFENQLARGIDVPVKTVKGDYNDPLSVFIMPKNEEYQDYAQYLLQDAVFDDMISFDTEATCSFNQVDDKFSVRDAFKLFLSLGFEYEPEECLYKDIFNPLPITEVQEQIQIANISENQINKKDEKLLRQLIKKDKVQEVKELIQEHDSKKIKLWDFFEDAYSNDSIECFKLFLKEGVILWGDNSGIDGRCPAQNMIFFGANKKAYPLMIEALFKEDFLKQKDYLDKVSRVFTGLFKYGDKKDAQKMFNHIKDKVSLDEFNMFVVSSAKVFLDTEERANLQMCIEQIKNDDFMKKTLIDVLKKHDFKTGLFLIEQMKTKGIDLNTITVNKENYESEEDTQEVQPLKDWLIEMRNDKSFLLNKGLISASDTRDCNQIDAILYYLKNSTKLKI